MNAIKVCLGAALGVGVGYAFIVAITWIANFILRVTQ